MSNKTETRQGVGCPHKGLLSAIIHRAIEESLKPGAITNVKKHLKTAYMDNARYWLRNSDTCKHYCALIDLCHETMVERLELQWGK